MIKKLAFVILFISSAIFSIAQTADGSSWINTDYNTTEGTEFYVTFMYNYGKQVDDEDLVLTLYATARENAHITIYGTWTDFVNESYTYPYVKSFDVDAGKIDSIFVPNQVAYLQESNQTEKLEWLNKGLYVVSDKPISLYAHNADASSYDASLIIPILGLYKEYVIQTFSRDAEATEFAIVAAKATTIDIDLHETNAKGELTRTPIHISLGAHQSYSYRPLNKSISLTGTTICSQEPIAVFQGGQHAKVPYDADGASHIFTQTYSTDFWGKEHIATRTHNQDIDIVRITAAENNTIIYRNGIEVKNIQALETYEDKIEWKNDEYAVYYSTTKAVCCCLYHSSADYNDTQKAGSPAVTPITPQEQGIQSVIVAPFDEMSTLKFAPDLTTEEDLKNYKHYVNIVVSTKDVNSMKIGDKDISLSFYPIEGTPYSVATCELTEQSQIISNTEGVFTARVYGQMEGKRPYTSYAYSAGSRVNHSADMLLNDIYTDSIAICDNEPIDLKSIVRYDYSNIEWELIDSLQGESSKFSPKIVGTDHTHVLDSFPPVTTGSQQDWTVNLFVERITPLCAYLIRDTISATVRVYRTHYNDSIYSDGEIAKKICYGEPFEIKYVERGSDVSTSHSFIADTTTVWTINHNIYGKTKFALDSIYVFKDSLHTIHDCDSIIEQRFIIRPTYDTIVKDTICYQNLPYIWEEKDGRFYFELKKSDLVNKHNLHLTQHGKILVDSIVKEVKLQTIHGCDSIVTMHLLVLPDYEFHENREVCQDSIDTAYKDWSGHVNNTTGKVLTSHHLYQYIDGEWKSINTISIRYPGNFQYRDVMSTKYLRCKSCEDNKGCDSIFYLNLHVKDHVINKSDTTLCDDSYVIWEGKVHMGANCPEPESSLPKIRYTNTLVHLVSQHEATQQGHCDSTFTLDITFCKSYPKPKDDIYHICENESHKFVDGKTYSWKTTNKEISKFILEDTILTTKICTDGSGCDSVVRHIIYVHPIYRDTTDTVVCLEPNKYFNWPTHTVNQFVWDVKNKTRIPIDEISISTAGDYTYIDSLKTITCRDCENGVGCDSIWVLKLRVNPTYYYENSSHICDSEAFTWEQHKCGHNQDTTLSHLSAGKYVLWDSMQTINGCDSIYKYILYVDQTYKRYDTLTINDEQFVEWCDTIFAGNKSGLIPTNRTVILPVGQYDRVANYHAVTTCDSTIFLHLIIRPTYHGPIEDSIVCQYEPFVWSKHEGHPLVDDDDNPVTISTKNAGVYVYYDKLKTILGDDSIHTLKLTVYPIYEYDSTKTICEGDSVWWDNAWRKGKAVTQDNQMYAQYFGNIKFISETYENRYSSIHGCDSVQRLHLIVNPRKHLHTEEQACDYDETFLGNVTYPARPSGIYYDTVHLTTTNGCDSVLTRRLQINKSSKETIIIEKCNSELPVQYIYDGTTYTFYHAVDTLLKTPSKVGTSGCDSVRNFILIVHPTYEYDSTKTICEGDSVWWDNAWRKGKAVTQDNQMYAQYFGNIKFISETYENRYSSIHGCDSVQRLHLIINPRAHTHLNISICDNEDYNFEGKLYSHPSQGIYYDTITINTTKNCDSVITLTLNVYPTYLFETSKLIGSNETYEWRGKIIQGADYQGLIEPVIFWDSIEGGTVGHHCDSVYKLTLQVAPSYHFYDQARICSNEEFRWSHLPNIDTTFQGTDISLDGVHVGVNIYRDTLRTIMDCDSIFELQLIVDSAYLLVGELDTTRIDICANETYHFKSLSKDTTINNNGDLANADKSINIFILEGMDTTIHGCDSAVCHKVYIHPTYDFTQKEYICQDTIDTEWEWIDDQGGSHGKYPRDKAGVYQLGDHKYTKQGCDSVFGIELHVMPIYRFDTTLFICESDSISWQNILFVGNQFSAYGKEFDATLYDSIRTNMTAGEYTSIVRHHTNIYHCDSTYIAKIIVSKVYRTTIERRTCQTTDGYYYEHLNRGSGGFLPAQYLSDSLTRNDTIQSIQGCDSIITLKFFVDSVYDYRQAFEVCQDTINTQWEWIDDDNISHGFISIADSGNYTYEQKYKTIHGCDSIYGMKIRVKPIYRFDSTYSICENERISWQHRWYAGDSATASKGDSILKPGQYYDTARYLTRELCDSIYYLVLNVYPIYDTLTKAVTCENEGYTWYQSDLHGLYEDVIYPASSYHKFYLTSDEASDNQPKPLVDTTMRRCDRLLKTIHECDSLSHLELVIYPAYMFITDTTICGNVTIKYRGKFFRGQDTTYMDSLRTKDGCDSIYQLRLHVRPIFISHEYRELCDNQTIYHESSNGKEVIWEPGKNIPDPDFEYIDAVYTDNNGCDSIYRYHLNIHPTFFQSDSDTICSNTHYLFHNSTDISLLREYEVSNWVQPFDTIFKDSLQTSYGCDSVYWLYAHIIPAYRDVLFDTICDNQIYLWRNHRIELGSNPFQFKEAGNHIFRDSLISTDGCDSIYELRLHVTPTFYEEYIETICADEYYSFRGEQINAAGVYYDSLMTIHGCDSVYQLFLTVLDTTYEIRDDTMCIDEPYNLHGVWLDKPGFYKDTTLNDWGCHHFTYLDLSVIGPTIPHAWADSLCKNHESFDVMFTYTGIKPIMYSLYFDDFGHSQGFEDIIHEPIDDELWDNEAYPMTIQMPWRDGDSTKYPRPDHYPVEIFLFNGYCIDSLRSRHDTDIVMSYPSWITEQRFQDVIAILSTKYNGGYTFETYQWYKDGEPLIGETHEYLYLPQELDTLESEYWVRLTRPGETESFQTCPITIHEYNVDTVAPYYDYLSVVPTYVVKEHPVVNILTHGNKGVYKIYNPLGLLIQDGEFHPGEHNAFEVTLPSLQGMYLFYLHSDEAIYEKDRTIRVLVE